MPQCPSCWGFRSSFQSMPMSPERRSTEPQTWASTVTPRLCSHSPRTKTMQSVSTPSQGRELIAAAFILAIGLPTLIYSFQPAAIPISLRDVMPMMMLHFVLLLMLLYGASRIPGCSDLVEAGCAAGALFLFGVAIFLPAQTGCQSRIDREQ